MTTNANLVIVNCNTNDVYEYELIGQVSEPLA